MITGPPLKMYRCVYCRRRVNRRQDLPAHEAVCDARYIQTRQWAITIEKARRLEKRAQKPAA